MHGDRLAGQRAGRHGHARGLQVGRRRQRDRRRAHGGADVVAGRTMLEHGVVDVGHHQQAVDAGEVEGQRHPAARRVGVVDGQAAAAQEGAEQDVAAVERAVGGQVHGVAPAARGDEVALVAHAPQDIDSLPALGRGRCGDDLDRQIRRRAGQADGRRCAGVVGPGVGLEDQRRRVGLHKQVQAALDEQGQRHGLAGAVLRTGVQRGGVSHVGQHHVVGIAKDGVAAEHDAVEPVRR